MVFVGMTCTILTLTRSTVTVTLTSLDVRSTLLRVERVGLSHDDGVLRRSSRRRSRNISSSIRSIRSHGRREHIHACPNDEDDDPPPQYHLNSHRIV
eukprot:scaffold66958_cov49-Attheya_sp.AAC.1